MAETHTPTQTLEAFGAAFLRLHSLVHSDEVAEMRVKRGHVVANREDTGRRSSGSHTDPVVDTLLDPRRTNVADAADHGERVLKAALHNLQVAAARLHRAQEEWAG